jgi:hypothetical protein
MFGDFGYLPTRQQAQGGLFQAFLADVGTDLLAIAEMGAGVAVPTVRYQGERLVQARNARLIRINPRDPETPESEVSLPMGSVEALRQIDERINLSER